MGGQGEGGGQEPPHPQLLPQEFAIINHPFVFLNKSLNRTAYFNFLKRRLFFFKNCIRRNYILRNLRNLRSRRSLRNHNRIRSHSRGKQAQCVPDRLILCKC
jgi:hypothetical protein